MSVQELVKELDNLLKCTACQNAVCIPIYQCCNGHLICLKCTEHIEKLPPSLKKCTYCGIKLYDKRNRNLVAEALLTLFPSKQSDEKTVASSESSQITDEIITYKIICKELSVFLDHDRRKGAMIKLTRNSYVEVVSIIDDPNENVVIGKLKTGGSICLNNSLTGEIFAIPLDIGVYQNQTDNNQVTTEFNISSEKKGILEKDVFFDVVGVRYCSQNNLVRAELSTGFWVNLINVQTEEIYAKPLQLGAYITNDENEAYFDIIEISHAPEINRVRGQLPTQEWFSLVNTEEGSWAASPLELGIYRTKAPLTNVYKGLEKDSPVIKTLHVGEIVDILLALTVPNSDVIRGKLTSGGWVDLIDNETGLHYAEHLKLGLYQTGREEVCTTEMLDLKSKSQISIAPFSHIEICEIGYLAEENCVRGRIQSGGWISLYNTIDETTFANPVPLGAYCILEGISITENEMAESNEIQYLSSHSFCDIVELKHIDADSLDSVVRGRLSTKGWINIIRRTSVDVQRWADPVPLGVYKAIIDSNVTFTSDMKSETLYENKKGKIFEVIETRLTKNNDQVRGRISTGGWITLVSTDGSIECAKPLHLGIYKTTMEQKVYEKSHTKSSRRKISANIVIIITELRLLPDVVRGKLSLDMDGWIDIDFAKPMPLGRYKVLAKTFQSSGPSIKSKVGKKVKKGSIIEVTYIQIMMEEERVRARLITGGWISLMNISDGFEWAEYIG